MKKQASFAAFAAMYSELVPQELYNDIIKYPVEKILRYYDEKSSLFRHSRTDKSHAKDLVDESLTYLIRQQKHDGAWHLTWHFGEGDAFRKLEQEYEMHLTMLILAELVCLDRRNLIGFFNWFTNLPRTIYPKGFLGDGVGLGWLYFYD